MFNLINWSNLWIRLFGTAENGWLHLDVGFWVSMFLVAFIVVVYNIVFWNLKPSEHKIGAHPEIPRDDDDDEPIAKP